MVCKFQFCTEVHPFGSGNSNGDRLPQSPRLCQQVWIRSVVKVGSFWRCFSKFADFFCKTLAFDCLIETCVRVAPSCAILAPRFLVWYKRTFFVHLFCGQRARSTAADSNVAASLSLTNVMVHQRSPLMPCATGRHPGFQYLSPQVLGAITVDLFVSRTMDVIVICFHQIYPPWNLTAKAPENQCLDG